MAEPITKMCKGYIHPFETQSNIFISYLKQNKKALYQQLLVQNKLAVHLIDIDEVATTRVEIIIKSLAEKEKVDENLKANNQLKWVGLMNNFKLQAEEIVLNELINS